MASDLLGFARRIAQGSIKVIDLTATLSQEFPTIVLPPEFGQAAPFRIEEISRYDERGPAWYWNNFSMSEHAGTHFDAPVHWISGKDLPNNAVDTIDPRNFIAPANVIDCSAACADNPSFILTVEHIEAWEKQHGRINPGEWVLLRTDWSNMPVSTTRARIRRVQTRPPSNGWSSSVTCTASAPRRSAPITGKATTSIRRFRRIIICTARAATACNA